MTSAVRIMSLLIRAIISVWFSATYTSWLSLWLFQMPQLFGRGRGKVGQWKSGSFSFCTPTTLFSPTYPCRNTQGGTRVPPEVNQTVTLDVCRFGLNTVRSDDGTLITRTDWLTVHWLTDWLMHTDWLTDWLTARVTDWLTGKWLTDWLTD